MDPPHQRNLRIGEIIVQTKQIKRKRSVMALITNDNIIVYFWTQDLDKNELEKQGWALEVHEFKDKRKHWLLPVAAQRTIKEKHFDAFIKGLKEKYLFTPNKNCSVEKIKQWEIAKNL